MINEKTANELADNVVESLQELAERYQERLSLIDAGETTVQRGEEDFVADKVQRLQELQKEVINALDDLSYIT